MLAYLKANNVRIFAIASAALAVVAHHAPNLPIYLYVPLVAAILGVGERVNAKTVHSDYVAVDYRDLEMNAEDAG